MGTYARPTSQVDEKSWNDIIRILPHVLPPIIDAVTKSAPSKGLPQYGGISPTRFDGIQENQKFLNILVPVLTTIIPPLIEAATKGFGFSANAGASTPFGGFGGGVGFEAKSAEQGQPDQKFILDLLTIILPPLIDVITKGEQPAGKSPTASNDKFIELLPVILPPLINILTNK